MTDNRYLVPSVILKGEMVVVGGQRSATVDLYRNGKWKRMDAWSMPHVNDGICAVAYDKYIYQIGGNGGPGVLRLNTETDSYEDMPSLPSGQRTRYHRCQLTTIKGELGILVTGGNQLTRGNVELLNSTNSLLTTIKEEDEILVSRGSSIGNVEFLNVANHQWTQLASLRQARYQHGLEMINGKPTVFGGYYEGDHDILDDFEYYDEVQDAWHTIPNMKLATPRRSFAYVRVNVERINNKAKLGKF